MKKDNNLLLAVLVGIGAYLFTQSNSSSSSGGGRFFQVPGVGIVSELQLPALGFVQIRGLWFNRVQVENFIAAQQTNVNAVQAAQSLFSQIQNVASSFQDVQAIFQQFVPTANVESVLAGDPGNPEFQFIA